MPSLSIRRGKHIYAALHNGFLMHSGLLTCGTSDLCIIMLPALLARVSRDFKCSFTALCYGSEGAGFMSRSTFEAWVSTMSEVHLSAGIATRLTWHDTSTAGHQSKHTAHTRREQYISQRDTQEHASVFMGGMRRKRLSFDCGRVGGGNPSKAGLL